MAKLKTRNLEERLFQLGGGRYTFHLFVKSWDGWLLHTDSFAKKSNCLATVSRVKEAINIDRIVLYKSKSGFSFSILDPSRRFSLAHGAHFASMSGREWALVALKEWAKTELQIKESLQ